MFEAIDRYAPGEPKQRLAAAVVAAVVGILALGDATDMIAFPTYQLGLPDAAWANAIVFAFGVALLVVGYRFVEVSLGEVEPAVAAPPTPDGGFDERDPERILAARYARGELDDDQFERMKVHLRDFDDPDDSTTEEYDTRTDFAENHELRDRETIID